MTDEAVSPQPGRAGRFAARHARSLGFLLVIIVSAGIAASFVTPVSLFPQVSFPRLRITLDAGDRPAERMDIEVTRPVEEALRTIPGVTTIRSTSSRGEAELSANFAWGQDMVVALLQAQAALSRVLPGLPKDTHSEIVRMDPTVFPVVSYSLTSDTRSLVELRDLARFQLRPLLATVPGVARVEAQGGAIEEFRIEVDPDKLRSYGLTIGEVSAALAAHNSLAAVGRLEDHHKLYLVISDTRLTSTEQMNEVVLRARDDGVVRVEDVATVGRSVTPNFWRVSADGHDGVLLLVFQQPGGNTTRISQEIRARLGEAKNVLPADVRLANWYDQSELILSAATSMREAVLIGTGLAALVLLVFLRSWRVVVVAFVAVPTTLAATALTLYGFGLSFNIMTLGGMAAAVGLIIDDAIVMTEHVVRRLNEPQPAGRREVVAAAAAEFTPPLAGSSASTMIIFAPLAFLSGVSGQFFKALAATMAAGLFFSFLLAWLVVPLLVDRLLAREKPHDPGRVARQIDGFYTRSLRGLLRHAWLVPLSLVPLFGLGYYALGHVPSGFIPPMDEGGFILDYLAAPGTSLKETDRLIRRVEAILLATPEVQSYSRRTGLQLGGGLTEANQGDFFIRLRPLPRRPLDQVMEEVRQRVESSVPGLQIETMQLMEDLIGDLTAVPQPLEVKLYSDDQAVLRELAPKVAAEIGKIRGVVDVKPGIVLAGDALDIHVDATKAALEGVDPAAISQAAEAALGGSIATSVQAGPKMVDVRVWLPRSARSIEHDVGRVPVRAPDGHVFPLKRVATVSADIGQPQISREDLQRMVAVTARISGRDLGSTAAELKAALGKSGVIPNGLRWHLGGLYEQQQIAFRGLAIVIAAALFLVFLLLLLLYERFRVALAILLSTLAAVAAVLVGLWLTGTELNITAVMGMTMVVGIATEVGIFYVSEYVALPAAVEPTRAAERERLVTAGSNRLRAIAMTTVAAILALLPLALSASQGSAMLQPLAVAIIAGLIAQPFCALFVLPGLLALLRAK